jgi:ZIP family zinc transporter
MDLKTTIILSFTLPCLLTTLGAALVFFFVKQSKILNVLAVGAAAGIMLSASIWSLLLPAIENAKTLWGALSVIPVCLGFVLGCIFMVFLDFLTKKFVKTDHQKPFKLFAAITIHNIPEGLSVGFAVGTAAALHDETTTTFMLALGIALQNFPEGLATALPLQKPLGTKKAFLFGTLSGIVEPIFAVAGFFLAKSISSLLSWFLSFSAGAMIYVIVEELMPELQEDKAFHKGTWAFLLGFAFMMFLDIFF